MVCLHGRHGHCWLMSKQHAGGRCLTRTVLALSCPCPCPCSLPEAKSTKADTAQDIKAWIESVLADLTALLTMPDWPGAALLLRRLAIVLHRFASTRLHHWLVAASAYGAGMWVCHSDQRLNACRCLDMPSAHEWPAAMPMHEYYKQRGVRFVLPAPMLPQRLGPAPRRRRRAGRLGRAAGRAGGAAVQGLQARGAGRGSGRDADQAAAR